MRLLYKILFFLFFVNICFSQNQIYTIKYPNVRFGMFAPTVLSSDQENDTYIRTDNGLFSGVFIEEYVYDITSNTWILVVSSSSLGITTNSISSIGNTMTSEVNGISDNATIINTNVLTYSSDSLTSIINGVISNKVKITSGGLTFKQALTIVNLRL